jgi:hypothetical protein
MGVTGDGQMGVAGDGQKGLETFGDDLAPKLAKSKTMSAKCQGCLGYHDRML